MYSTRRSSANLLIKEEELDEEEDNGEAGGVQDERPLSRRSSVRAAANSVRKNVVRTVRRSGASGRSTTGNRRGKSIRVIEDA